VAFYRRLGEQGGHPPLMPFVADVSPLPPLLALMQNNVEWVVVGRWKMSGEWRNVGGSNNVMRCV